MTNSLLTSEQEKALKQCLGKVYPPSGRNTYFRKYEEDEDGLLITLEFKHTYVIRIPYFEVEDFIANFTEMPPEEEPAAEDCNEKTATVNKNAVAREAGTIAEENSRKVAQGKKLRTREMVIGLIAKRPLSHKELLRETGMKEVSLYYHTTALKKEGRICLNKDGRYYMNPAGDAAVLQARGNHAAPDLSEKRLYEAMPAAPQNGMRNPEENALTGNDAGLRDLMIRNMEYHKSKYENLKKAMELISHV
ncbi:MAG: hypothetical protein HKL88_06930 [Bacteroidia bacterium]|nr:hypothetical protein [Bacteroidia bacterium]